MDELDSSYDERPSFGAPSAIEDEDITLDDDVEIERASLDVPIQANNVGFRLLQKMGWHSGTGLGKAGQGRVEPIRVELQSERLGLGKATEYAEKLDETAKNRKGSSNWVHSDILSQHLSEVSINHL